MKIIDTDSFRKAPLLFFLITFLSCKKEGPGQGTNFNRLLKTVTKNAFAGDLNISTEYTYDATGQVSEIVRTFWSSSSNPEIQKDTYYRNAAGFLDSITYRKNDPQSSSFHNVHKTEFFYDNTGKVLYCLNKTNVSTYVNDSVVYHYPGNYLSQRQVYRSPAGSGNYTLIVTFNYRYDAAGNLLDMESLLTNPNSRKTCTYTYDNKPNTLPVMEYENELYGNWFKAFDNTFTTPNNLTSRRVQPGWDWDWGDKDFEYKYTSGNKPLYLKVTPTGETGFQETWYYYD